MNKICLKKQCFLGESFIIVRYAESVLHRFFIFFNFVFTQVINAIANKPGKPLNKRRLNVLLQLKMFYKIISHLTGCLRSVKKSQEGNSRQNSCNSFKACCVKSFLCFSYSSRVNNRRFSKYILTFLEISYLMN